MPLPFLYVFFVEIAAVVSGLIDFVDVSSIVGLDKRIHMCTCVWGPQRFPSVDIMETLPAALDCCSHLFDKFCRELGSVEAVLFSLPLSVYYMSKCIILINSNAIQLLLLLLLLRRVKKR